MGGYSLVKVEWQDIVAEVGWQDTATPSVTHPCSSVGWIISETHDTLVLASTMSIVDDKNENNNRIAIPKATITRIYDMKVVQHG